MNKKIYTIAYNSLLCLLITSITIISIISLINLFDVIVEKYKYILNIILFIPYILMVVSSIILLFIILKYSKEKLDTDYVILKKEDYKELKRRSKIHN